LLTDSPVTASSPDSGFHSADPIAALPDSPCAAAPASFPDAIAALPDSPVAAVSAFLVPPCPYLYDLADLSWSDETDEAFAGFSPHNFPYDTAPSITLSFLSGLWEYSTNLAPDGSELCIIIPPESLPFVVPDIAGDWDFTVEFDPVLADYYRQFHRG